MGALKRTFHKQRSPDSRCLIYDHMGSLSRLQERRSKACPSVCRGGLAWPLYLRLDRQVMRCLFCPRKCLRSLYLYGKFSCRARVNLGFSLKIRRNYYLNRLLGAYHVTVALCHTALPSISDWGRCGFNDLVPGHNIYSWTSSNNNCGCFCL